MTWLRPGLFWLALGLAVGVPAAFAVTSPLLAWRGAVYIAAGFAGVIALSLLLLQPLLIGGVLPGVSKPRQRRLHRIIGSMLLVSIILHVGGLWLTSPPDVIDALLFDSPTPFSNWGVIAMWAVVATAALAAGRRRIRIHPQTWRRAHAILALIIAIGSVVHALLIDGTMETLSKAALCALVVAAVAIVVADRRLWAKPAPTNTNAQRRPSQDQQW